MKNKKRLFKSIGLMLIVMWSLAVVVIAYRLSTGSEFGKDSLSTMAVVVFALAAAATITAYICIVKKSVYERLGLPGIYLISGLLIGLAFTILMPVGVVPDEMEHVRNAYECSNVMMGYGKKSNHTIKMRTEDFETPSIDIAWNHKNSEIYYSNLFTKAEKTEVIDTDVYCGIAPDYVFIVPATGITLGRLLHLGTRTVYLLGRIFCVLAYVLLVYAAMRLLPFGQILAFVWGFLPMVQQQSNSFSYDRQVLSVSLLIVALTLHLYYGKSTKHTRWKVAILVLSCLYLLPIKHGALVPITLIPMIFFGRWYLKKRKTFSKKQKTIIRVCVIVFALAVVAAAAVYLRICLRPDRVNGHWVRWAGEPGYTIGFLLLHPGQLAKILYNTVLQMTDFYIAGMLGGLLSWHTKAVPNFLLLPFVILLVAASFRREDEEELPGLGVRVWTWLMCLLVIGFTFAGMLLNWTPMSFDRIEGVQGRYFLPLVVPVLLMCRTKHACIGKYAERVMAMIAVLLQMPIMMYLYMQVV